MKHVNVQPEDVNGIPFAQDCRICEGLKKNPQPGLSMWCSAVASHLSTKHEIMLVG